MIVETGAGIPTANALVTLVEFDTYLTDYGISATGTDDEKTAAIVRASLWVSTYPDWTGDMTYGRGLQGLAIPRSGMTDCNGDTVPSDEVPTEAKQAIYIAAAAELTTPGVLTPTITPGKQQKRVKVDVIEIENMTPADQGKSRVDPVMALRPVLTQIEDLLRCLASFRRTSTPWPQVL